MRFLNKHERFGHLSGKNTKKAIKVKADISYVLLQEMERQKKERKKVGFKTSQLIYCIAIL